MMRILHTEYSMGWGGQEMRILNEALGMRQRGHALFFAVQKGSKLAEKARAHDFIVIECDFRRRKALVTIPVLLTFIGQHGIEALNTHSSKDAWIGGIAARFAGIHVIRTRHLSCPVKGGLNSRILYKYLADFVITTSSIVIEDISKKAALDPQYLRCIATGVNIDRVQASEEEAQAFRKQWNIADEDFLIGTICVVRSWKGIQDLIQAADLLRAHSDIKFLVVGGGYLDHFTPEVEKRGLKNIVFTGHIDRPFAAARALNVFCLLSTANEGISQASLQAAYLCKPLITTRVGGLPEVCIEGQTGFLVNNHSPQEIADKIHLLKKDPAFRKQLGENAHKLVMEKYTEMIMLDETEAVYRDVLRKKREHVRTEA